MSHTSPAAAAGGGRGPGAWEFAGSHRDRSAERRSSPATNIGGGTLSVRIMNKPVQWAAELAHVREVSLLGTADLAFWKARLLKENLRPAEQDGQAQLVISAADSKYRGVRFRELSFSVRVSWLEERTRPDAAYLVRAFNSCRLFAFLERVFFSTPYYHGDVRVSASLPPSIHLVMQGEFVFQAEMAADGSALERAPSR